MRIAVIGDIHKHWDERDTRYFNESDYDLILIVGDLPGRANGGFERVTRELSGLMKPALLIPGNHDGVTVMQKLAELKQKPKLIERFGRGQAERCDRWREDLRPVELVGYSRHAVEVGGIRLDVVAARPHSMGGPTLAFRPYLRERFGVASLEASAQKLKSIFDDCDNPILVLAHNGPTGLGDRATDIWGCDFRPEEGDFGDPDLEAALRHARDSGKTILGVVAGHMHHKLKGRPNETRAWLVERDGIRYINAARVPRTEYGEGVTLRHHVALRLSVLPSEANAVGGAAPGLEVEEILAQLPYS